MTKKPKRREFDVEDGLARGIEYQINARWRCGQLLCAGKRTDEGKRIVDDADDGAIHAVADEHLRNVPMTSRDRIDAIVAIITDVKSQTPAPENVKAWRDIFDRIAKLCDADQADDVGGGEVE